MNDSEFQKNVSQVLDRSASRIDHATLKKLRMVRTHAMERFDAHGAEPMFAWAGWSWRGAGFHRSHYYWIAAILLVVFALNGVAYWKHERVNDDVAADIAILTDEMPIKIYLD